MEPGERHRAAQALPTPGQVIAGKYAIVKVIGEGGMGIVFEAMHLKLRQRVAVKMLLPDMLAHEIILTRFEREARASGQLRNRHAARVMDVDVTAEGLPYMVMEFLEGHDLQVELERRGRLPLEEAVEYVLQACSAMAEAHQLGIVHRDLKPSNLFLALEDSSDRRVVKVLDFGISKVQAEGEAKLTVAESVIGTAMYMSPEQVRSSQTVDVRSDIWSLGIILFELLAGRPPWVGTPTQLAATVVSEDAPDVRTHLDVPADVAAIIAKALRRDPRQRFDDVKQLAFALSPFGPAGSAGRLAATGRLDSSSGAYPRVSIQPKLEEAQTHMQASAVSESRMSGDGPGGLGTAPGWSQHGAPAARSRTFVIGFIAAFAVGLLVVGGLARLWLRSRAAQPTSAASAVVVAQAGPTAATVSVATAGAVPSPTTADPLPPAPAPAPPSSSGAVTSPAGIDSAAPRVHATAHPAATSPAAPRKSAAPPSSTKPVAAPSGNPLLL